MSNITLTIPNDDHVALRAFGKALEEMALAHGAPLRVNPQVTVEKLREAMENAEPTYIIPEVDTTAQQVESLSDKREEFEQIVDDVKVAASEFLNVPSHVLTGQEAPPTTDSTSTPWDERIHSASKALNADGTWRLRRKPKDMDELEWSDYVSLIKADLQYPVECGGEGVNDIEPPVTPFYTPENYVHMYRAADNIYGLAKSDDELAEFEADGYVRHTQEQYDAWEGPNTADADVVTEQTVAGIPPLPVPPPVALPGSTGATDLLPPPPVGTVVMQSTWDFPRLMTFLTERHGKIDVATVNTLLAQDGMLSVQELNAHPDKIGPFVARVKAHLGE